MMDSTRLGMLGGRFAAVAGCYALAACGPSTSRMTVELRDAPSGIPIVGAGVEANSLGLGPSLQFGDVVDQALGKRASLTSRALTDGHGRATLEVVAGRAVRVMALVPGQAPAFALFEQAGPTAWNLMTTDPGARPVEVRVAPPMAR